MKRWLIESKLDALGKVEKPLSGNGTWSYVDQVTLETCITKKLDKCWSICNPHTIAIMQRFMFLASSLQHVCSISSILIRVGYNNLERTNQDLWQENLLHEPNVGRILGIWKEPKCCFNASSVANCFPQSFHSHLKLEQSKQRLTQLSTISLTTSLECSILLERNSSCWGLILSLSIPIEAL